MPSTLHDYSGFDPALYQLRYPAAGDPLLAQRIAVLLSDQGWVATTNGARGLDHGAWVPLRYLYPQAQLPVLQLSMPIALNTESALQLGRALRPLRSEGVLIVGSGSLTHNLREFRAPIRDREYAQEFVDWVRPAVLNRDAQALGDYRLRAPHAARAHPSEEHFLPLLIALGASYEGDPIRWLDGGISDQVLSMDSVLFGT